MSKIIVLNLGSTSFKFKLFEFESDFEVLASGEVESIGSLNSNYRITINSRHYEDSIGEIDHKAAFRISVGLLQELGVFASLDELDAVAYKAVHGGSVNGAQIVDDNLLTIMDEYTSFAPAHNPIYSSMMQFVRKEHPGLVQVACFETSFHATVPEYRAAYGVPLEWKEKYGIRRYGFHGSSHSYIAKRIKEISPSSERVISIHLGGSSSLCAIQNGESIATSMGATPQSGLFHNNRVGDFDVFCLPRLIEEYEGDVDAVMKVLSSESGFLGLSGNSNDLRVVLKSQEHGDKNAELAVSAFVDNIIGYIGMFTAYMNGLDALVFTGGIGTRSSVIRAMVCEKLGFLSLELDQALNIGGIEGQISTKNSMINVWIMETNEELMVAGQAFNLLNGID